MKANPINANPSLYSFESFIAYPKEEEFQGTKGFGNLVALLKTDVQAILHQYAIRDVAKITRKLSDLKRSLVFYGREWDEWSKSSFCPFSQKDVQLINLYVNNPDIKAAAMNLGVSYFHAASKLSAYYRRLSYTASRNSFQEWKKFKEVNMNDRETFLKIPLIGLRHIIPTRLILYLSDAGNNLSDILNTHTEKDLLKYRNFGQTKLQEFKETLKKYDCLHLLKKS